MAELKASAPRTIAMSGCATTVRWLLSKGLLDELVLLVDPITVGTGARLFADGDRTPLTLLSSEAFETALLHLRYAPAPQVVDHGADPAS